MCTVRSILIFFSCPGHMSLPHANGCSFCIAIFSFPFYFCSFVCLSLASLLSLRTLPRPMMNEHDRSACIDPTLSPPPLFHPSHLCHLIGRLDVKKQKRRVQTWSCSAMAYCNLVQPFAASWCSEMSNSRCRRPSACRAACAVGTTEPFSCISNVSRQAWNEQPAPLPIHWLQLPKVHMHSSCY